MVALGIDFDCSGWDSLIKTAVNIDEPFALGLASPCMLYFLFERCKSPLQGGVWFDSDTVSLHVTADLEYPD